MWTIPGTQQFVWMDNYCKIKPSSRLDMFVAPLGFAGDEGGFTACTRGQEAWEKHAYDPIPSHLLRNSRTADGSTALLISVNPAVNQMETGRSQKRGFAHLREPW